VLVSCDIWISNVVDNCVCVPKCVALHLDVCCCCSLSLLGSQPGIQLAHAGRKGVGSFQAIAPSPIAFDKYPVPEAMSLDRIHLVTQQFCDAARRAITAGFKLLELHFAHGYLVHEFLSPQSNHRTDEYGGSFENRTRFAREVTSAVRKCMPDTMPLFVRISASDWQEPNVEAWDLEQSVQLSKMLRDVGADLIDVSSGGGVPHQKIPLTPLYQVPFAREIKHRVDGVLVGAVGLITTPEQCEQILASGEADVVSLAREFLRDPYFPFTAADALGVHLSYWPKQYERARLK
jgi:2,4-dienoyl-CoA reductase-like NADH-dependent reductase (Old Yellow Enzyme family)